MSTVSTPDFAAAIYASAIGGSTQHSVAVVTPAEINSLHAYSIAFRSLLTLSAGACLRIKSKAIGSRKVPLGDPSARLAIVPPSGFGVLALMPAISSALLFTQIVW